MRDWGKILLAVVENFLEKYLGKNALKELKQPALDEELKYKVAAAALRAEAHWAKHYSDSVIIEAIQTMPLHDLPSIQVAIMQMIEQPSSMTLPDNLKAQIRNILPNNFTDEQILPAVQSWLEVLKNELLGIDDFRKILQALAELETARNTSAVADDLHQLRLMVAELLQKRLEAPTLFDRLPNNDEGKEEFVRIMQLLLFHQARRQGKSSEFPILGGKLIINSDENYLIDFRDRSAFIYMFCASPISQKDRTRITEAITSACKNNGKEIILVTPGNLSELSSGRNISDKAWFDHLRSDLTNGIELSHWGHLKLLSMIKQTPALCLYYYPELMDSGTQKHTTIQDLTQRYITNLKAKYGNIEFVGMSVYKPEATRGVPMEAIYIPLSMVLTSGGNENSLGSHIDPLRQLKQGALTVILGDPGSGKSTLLRFLALAGKSSALQRKYKAKRDQRLPLLIVLRRYADELKQDHYLSIFDFILRSIKADFSLHGIDQDFLVYYLETGQAILLFDGLDELPNPDLKEIIRDRISSLAGTFPGNTIIVTSRIVGYDSQFRFDDRFFDHLQISKLSLTSIEQFVHDWYTVRIRDEAERNANIQDLIRIFRDKNHAAIRELAENPLLLTIIALVHRLDAVLPDERVVLYQKCTETLLNTWHAWKFRSVDTKEKDKQDRKNRRRLEVIAYWMHQRAGQVKANERSIIPYCELKEFLTDYITNIEKPSSLDYDAEDIADEFLRFINQRAGLLVEVGDRQYSFVHLTFQEYLASAHLLTTIEEGGVRGIWHEIAHRTSDNRWNEVIRLMIAGLRSYQAQEWILDTLLIETRADLNFTRGILVGGLLLDGVSSAVHSAHQIIEILFLIAARTSDDQLTQILGVTRAFLNKDTNNSVIIAQGVCLSLNGAISDYEKLAILLSAGSTGLSAQEMGGLLELLPDDEMLSKCWIKLFSHLGLTEAEKDFLKPMIERFMNIQTSLSLFSESTGYWSILGLAIVDLYDSRWLSSKAFDLAMISIFYDYQSNNPMQVYFNKYFDVAFLTKLFVSRRMLDRLRNGIDLIWYKKIKFIAHDLVGEFDKLVDDGITSKNIFWLFGKPDNLIDMMGGSVNESYLKKHEEQLKSKIKPCSPFEIIIFNNPKIFVARAAIQSALQFRLTLPHWPEFQNKPELHNQFLRFVMNCFRVKISCHATEYLRFNLLPEIPKRLEKLGDYNNPQNVEVSSTYSNDPYQLAWSILLTAYINKLKKNNNFLYVTQRFRDLEMSRELLDSLRDVDNPSIQVALALLSQVSGEQIAKNDLLTLYNSDDPRYIELFKRCYWKLTEQ